MLVPIYDTDVKVKQLNLIVAVTKNNVIGNNGDLIYKISSDLKRFKELTMGDTVIMGRKTYDSIGKPLPGRQNIVISRQELYLPCTVVNYSNGAIRQAESETAWVIGGGEIYRHFLPIANRVYMTVIDVESEGDTTFPQLPAEFKLIEDVPGEDSKFEHPFSFKVYER